ncbi:hypothetical protein GON26_15880 [Flavobacterium sp. GA093]|uniref:Uncharacterized protein n=1 Tax=Flavobacterium hydrocarbonoxydans TaxID=2683249 RepID=A0A6I4NN55_9FLAO|nr:hypothetical protein [Flavobacterium hydrocarbonoxydans]MWB95846.1 hypothetical protein [Flavobacterium hydrocarbonoxydans]
MLKTILNSVGVKELTKNEKKAINGQGSSYSDATGYCVSPSPTCGGVYPVQYPGGWCCQR